LKQLAEDPWTTVADKYEVGQVRTGTVTRVAEFGAFVELEPGVEALAHASTFPASGQRDAWRRTVKVGATGVYQVLSVDPDKKRIGVAQMPDGTTAAGLAEEAADQAAATARATVTQIAGFGSLGDKLRYALKGR
jgi:ribosomal protein S1